MANSRLLGVMLIGAALLCACAGAPVQEMSDARQAIRAATQAGAAADDSGLALAVELLESAEDHLRTGRYKSARADAISAHGHAVEALRTTEADSDQSQNPPPE